MNFPERQRTRRILGVGAALVALALVLGGLEWVRSGVRALDAGRDLAAFQRSMMAANTPGDFSGGDPRLPAGLRRQAFTSVNVRGFTAQAARLWSPFGLPVGVTLDLRRSDEHTWTVMRSICYGAGAWTFEVGTVPAE